MRSPALALVSLPPMLRTVFTWLLLAGAALVLAACCGSVACDCQDQNDDSFYFRFNLDSTSTAGFRAAQVQRVYISRSTPDTIPLVVNGTRVVRNGIPRDTIVMLSDTAIITRPARQVADPVIIGNTTPFTARAGQKVNSSTYSIFVLRAPRDTVRYQLTNLAITGDFEADGCCACYRNTNKTLRVDDSPFDATSEEPKPYTLNNKP